MKQSNPFPFHNRILIKVRDARIGALKINRGPKESIGDVIAVGPHVKDVRVGDIISFCIWAAEITNIEGEEFAYIAEYIYVNGDQESSVLALLNREPLRPWYKRLWKWITELL